MIAKTSKVDPYLNFNFKVQITGKKLGNIDCGFKTVTGLGVTTVFKEYREGGNNFIPDKLVDYVTDNAVTFVKGVTDNEAILDLVSMYYTAVSGAVGVFDNRVDINIELRNRTNEGKARGFSLIGCVIESFTFGELDAMGETFAIEGFTVRFNGLKSF